MHLTAQLTRLIVTVLLAVAAVTGLEIVFVLAQRCWRDRHFRRRDALHDRYRPVIEAVLNREMPYDRGLAILNSLPRIRGQPVLQRLLTGWKAAPTQVPLLLQLCQDTGLIARWRRELEQAVGPEYPRQARHARCQAPARSFRAAQAAENLGLVRHQPSWPLLVSALNSPNLDVRSTALRALATVQEPRSFAAIAEQLEKVAAGSFAGLSLRALRAALTSFPLQYSVELIPSLKHSYPRLRFLVTDVIREMVERQAAGDEGFCIRPGEFPAELFELFLTRLRSDPNPDVRARAVPVIARLEDARASAALVALLEDPAWFVRLHAVRSIRGARHRGKIARLSRRLTDLHWAVRQAAVRALLAFGPAGLYHLSEHFLTTADRYSREQIADEIQRAGVVPYLMAEYSREEKSRYARVIEELTSMGKTSYVVEVVRVSPDRQLRKTFLQRFGRSSDSAIQAWIRDLICYERDAEMKALAQAALEPAAI